MRSTCSRVPTGLADIDEHVYDHENQPVLAKSSSVATYGRAHDFAGRRVQDELAICSGLEWSITLSLGGNLKRLIFLDDRCLNVLREASQGRICRLEQSIASLALVIIEAKRYR